MKPLLLYAFYTLVYCCATNAQAGSIETFLSSNSPKKSYFHCAFQKKIASKKCLVSMTNVPATTGRAKSYFGANGRHELLTISWPDNDVSQYILLDNNELWNTKDNHSYQFRAIKDSEFELDLSKGLIIDKNFNENIRLW